MEERVGLVGSKIDDSVNETPLSTIVREEWVSPRLRSCRRFEGL